MATQSAAIPFRYDVNGEIQILLVTSRKRSRWVLPKGHVRKGMGPHSSAAKEAFEEGGVIGRTAAEPIITYSSKKKDISDGEALRVEVYPMAVTTEAPVWPEMHQRKRQWTTLQGALSLAEGKGVRKALYAFEKVYSPTRARRAVSPQF